MAETVGQVQRLKLTSGATLAWAYIGPSATNTRLLIVQQGAAGDATEVAFRASMAEALSGALASRQEVTATHGDNDSIVTVLSVKAG